MKIAFFLGSVEISGGTYVIYQHALHAQRAGHDVTIVVLYPYQQHQLGWHPATSILRFVPAGELGEEYFDLAIATWWKTANELHAINAGRYAYFVQSIESRFYPDRERPLQQLVDSTYELGLPTITEATWIQAYLTDRHQSRATLVKNGIRKDLYTSDGPIIAQRPAAGKLRVLVEGPFGVPFKNVGKSLRLARRANVGSTWLLSSSDLRRYPGVERVFSRIPINAVPPIYRSCDLILKLSYVEGMFGPPLEMFHCGGTAVVYDVTGHDEYIKNGVNALVLPRDDERGVHDALERLRDEPSLLQTLKQGALATAHAWPDWEHSSTAFEETLRGYMEGTTPSRAEIADRNREAMEEYVRHENIRLASVDSRPTTWARITAGIDSIPQLAYYRRIASYFMEAWP